MASGNETIIVPIVAGVAAAGIAVGSAAGSASGKRIPKRLRKSIVSLGQKIQKSNTRYEEFKRNNEKLFFVFSTFNAIFSLILYFLDMYTDVLLLFDFIKYNWIFCSIWSLIFLVIPYVVVMVGIYITRVDNVTLIDWENGKDTRKKIAFYLFFPILPLLFDIFMPFYRLTPFTPGALKSFMAQYEALRTICETVLESVPQFGLQVYMVLWCRSNTCNFVEEDDSILIQAFVVSIISILYRLGLTWFEIYTSHATIKNYLNELVKLGMGLPIQGIKKGQLHEVTIRHELYEYDVRRLADVLENNTSVRKLDLSKCKIGYFKLNILKDVLLKKDRLKKRACNSKETKCHCSDDCRMSECYLLDEHDRLNLADIIKKTDVNIAHKLSRRQRLLLGDVLRKNSDLQILDLHECGFDEEYLAKTNNSKTRVVPKSLSRQITGLYSKSTRIFRNLNFSDDTRTGYEALWDGDSGLCEKLDKLKECYLVNESNLAYFSGNEMANPFLNLALVIKTDKFELSVNEPLSKFQIKVLIDVLKLNHRLKVLDLSRCKLSDDQIAKFHKLLLSKNRLENMKECYLLNELSDTEKRLNVADIIKSTEIEIDFKLSTRQIRLFVNTLQENELLKRLDLSKCKINDSNFKKYVKKLLLKKLDIGMETCFLFSDKVNLAEIANNNTNRVVIDVDLSPEYLCFFSNIFNKNNSVKKIDFTNCKIDGKNLKILSDDVLGIKYLAAGDLSKSRLYKMEECYLYDKTINLAAIANNEGTDIVITKNFKALDRITLLGKVLKHNTSVKLLDLSSSCVEESEYYAILQAIGENTKESGSLLEIKLGSKQLKLREHKNSFQCAGLARVIYKIVDLETIRLINDDIDDYGIKLLAESLAKMTQLKQLSLWKNKITDEGTKALAEAIVNMPALEKLDLRDNLIGDVGAKALASALSQMSALNKLQLANNNIQLQGRDVLVEKWKTEPHKNRIQDHLELDHAY